MYTGDPVNVPSDRLRLIIGDTDVYDEGLTDEVYEYLLDKHEDIEGRAAIEALKYLVAKYANYVTEKAGGLFIKESERYEQYEKLLDKFTKDPATLLAGSLSVFAGGISKTEIEENRADCDNPTSRIRYINEGAGDLYI